MTQPYQLSPVPLFRVQDNNNRPLAGGKVFTFVAGTTTPQATYPSPLSGTPNPNPVILNSRGEAAIWLDPTLTYKIQVTDSHGNQIPGYPVDNVPGGTNLTQQGIGLLLYPRTAAEIAASVVPSNFAFPGPGQAPYVDVRRYGALGNGVSDDTAAIQTAINVLNNWTQYPGPYGVPIGNKPSPGPDLRQGGRVLLAPGLTFLITSPILLAPNIILDGGADIMWGTPSASAAGLGVATIKCNFSGSTLRYAIDTGSWRLKNNDGSPLSGNPYRIVDATEYAAAGALDSGIINFGSGGGVRNLFIDCNNTAVGGFRRNGWAFSFDDGFATINAMVVGATYTNFFEGGLGRCALGGGVGLLIYACESFMQSGPEAQVYAAATPFWVSGNQAIINSIVNPENDPVGSWYGLTTKAIKLTSVATATFGHLGGNSGNVGMEAYQSRVLVQHWENEFTDTVLFLVRKNSLVTAIGLSTKEAGNFSTGDSTSKLVIHEPKFVAGTSSNLSFTPLNSETSSTFEVQLYNCRFQDILFGTVFDASTVNVTKVFPDEGSLTLFVSSSGTASRAGFVASHPTTIDGALTFIANNPHIKKWSLIQAASDSSTISAAHSIEGATINFSPASGSCTLSASAVLSLRDCRLTFSSGVTLSGWSSTALFTVSGTVQADFQSGTVSIPASKSLFACGDFDGAFVTVIGAQTSITFGSGATLCHATGFQQMIYQDTFVGASVTGTAALGSGAFCLSSGIVPESTGWGTPTGAVVTANFPGATATLLQTSEAVAHILLALKRAGMIGN